MRVRDFIKDFMGRPVVFTQEFRRVSDRPAWGRRPGDTTKYVITWEPVDVRPSAGWAVGLRYLQTGYRAGPFMEEPACFVETAPRKLCALVTTWPTRKPLCVPLDALEVTETIGNVSAWSAEERKLVSEMAKTWTRDERGRFVKEDPLEVQRLIHEADGSKDMEK